eukprot:CAMPEP_0173396530 /NCGR_PEP_ID=MMETSP1356-20130122/35764_1 /TAXON_ID=77927 ORGANISM="Hemiselmis virescens, Strain PCC157" /NCGR_SAMPLE_ID=MMETSP1356 /ASSEMBLY_ACC=CAM_ASM_000847 /LENGTH=72 /DNA_ID=CAMNT_0014355591 /DNA_START=63 /DNA_END=278 /DNA_ORIENTATION=-
MSVLCVEHNSYLRGPSDQEAIFELLAPKGYVRVVKDHSNYAIQQDGTRDPGGGAYEDWYVHETYLSGLVRRR